jgi:CRISPR-associated endonuclease Csn1
MSASNTKAAGGTIWAFDLGKGSIGEAVRRGNEFLHKASLLIPADFAETKTAAGRRRMSRTREAHKAREQWLDQVMQQAGIEPLRGRRTQKVGGKWQSAPETDEQRKNRELLEREFAKPGDPTCYTSCLLRIKLLRGEKLEPWQIYKALHSAIQKRGYCS